jgi:dihydrofolate reductase
MTKVRINSFSISADGYGAGAHQSLDNPLGIGGMRLHSWALPTRTFQQTLFGKSGGTTGVDETFAARGFSNIGAWILGRNMFAPSRGPWPEDGWKGWWGDTPPYHTPVFVLTHYARAAIEMNGGTTFYFVTDGIHAALDRAREVANDKDIRIGGGVAVVRQYLQEGLVDQAHFAITPVLLGSGEHVFEGLTLPALGYDIVEHSASEAALHVVLGKATGLESNAI